MPPHRHLYLVPNPAPGFLGLQDHVTECERSQVAGLADLSPDLRMGEVKEEDRVVRMTSASASVFSTATRTMSFRLLLLRGFLISALCVDLMHFVLVISSQNGGQVSQS